MVAIADRCLRHLCNQRLGVTEQHMRRTSCAMEFILEQLRLELKSLARALHHRPARGRLAAYDNECALMIKLKVNAPKTAECHKNIIVVVYGRNSDAPCSTVEYRPPRNIRCPGAVDTGLYVEHHISKDAMNRSRFEHVLAGKKVLVTGHTGFTGGWACLWLKSLDARVTGFSLPPATTPSLFNSLQLADDIPTTYGDICDYASLLAAVESAEPDLILHLAAQPLVRQPYREIDALGGKDPYSASKAAAEMVIASYAASYPWSEGQGPAIAIARGGNIIGGGDWSEDRLIPDFVRAAIDGTKLTLRYPDAIRPWQLVLALVHGYLNLLAGMISDEPARLARARNFGPQDHKQNSVRNVLELMCGHWQRPQLEYMHNPLPEAGTLALDSSLARNVLDWLPIWDTERGVKESAVWYL